MEELKILQGGRKRIEILPVSYRCTLEMGKAYEKNIFKITICTY
jgi:hypothetical protein